MEQVLEAVLYPFDGMFLLQASNLSGHCWTGPSDFSRPLCATLKKGFCFAGVQMEARVANLTWIGDRGILVASDQGAVELWELDENEALADNKLCKYKHDDIVSIVSVLSSGIQTVSWYRRLLDQGLRPCSADGSKFLPSSFWADHLCRRLSPQGSCVSFMWRGQ